MKTINFDLQVEQDYTEVRGNAMASDDPDFDKQCEDKIIAELDGGNVWAWANVTMTACVDLDECWDSLGCCSYADRADFERGGYYDDMREQSLCLLRTELEEALEAVGRAEEECRIVREAHDKYNAELELWCCPECKESAACHPDDYPESGIPYCSECDCECERTSLIN